MRYGTTTLAGLTVCMILAGLAWGATTAPSTQPLPSLKPSAALAKPDAWFQTQEARQILANVLTWQTSAGGWIKNYNASQPRAPGAGDWDGAATIDNGSTHTEMRLLARAYLLTGRPEYRDAFNRGLNFLLLSQYPNGGWPQRFPLPNNYGRHITFNDNAMIEVMELLQDIQTGRSPFTFVDAAQRAKASQAVDKGVDCILRCQVVLNGKLTGWCAQHDEVTLAPATGRAYELPSLSGSEGARIVLFLMKLDHPDARVQRAVHAAAAWFASAKITGKRLVEIPVDGGRDRQLVDDPNAGPLWGRFYDLETGKPIIVSRDSVKHTDFNELPQERRGGYAWYGAWGLAVEKAYQKWKIEHPMTADSQP